MGFDYIWCKALPIFLWCRVAIGVSWFSCCLFLVLAFMFLWSWELVGKDEVNGA